jgi:tol-pal system protein YbgF
MPYLIIMLLAVCFLLPACLPGNGEQQRLLTMQAQLDNQSQALQDMARRLELATRSLEQNRGPQAALSNELNSLRQSVAQITGRLEEAQKHINSVQSADPLPQITDLTARVSHIERYLGINSRPPAAAGSGVKPGTPESAGAGEPSGGAGSDPKTIYEAGMRLYQQGSFPAAQDRFKELLRRFPNDPYSEQAQFQLGEALYAGHAYEDAILAYQKIIGKYPNSKFIPAAYLKQIMSFSALGDIMTVRLICNKLINEFPDTPEAGEARNILNQRP